MVKRIGKKFIGGEYVQILDTPNVREWCPELIGRFAVVDEKFEVDTETLQIIRFLNNNEYCVNFLESDLLEIRVDSKKAVFLNAIKSLEEVVKKKRKVKRRNIGVGEEYELKF